MRLAIAVLLLAVVAAFLWLKSGGASSPAEVAWEDTAAWMERLREPGQIKFVQRAPVQAVDTAALPSRTVATLGLLDEPVEVALIANFEQQLRSFAQQIKEYSRPADGDALGELGAELRVGELQETIAQMKLATELIRAREYVTVKAGTQLPPEVDGFDRIVHGYERLRGEAVQVVLYVPQDRDPLLGAREYRRALYWGYWEAFVATINAQPLASRKARIERHLQARSQQSEGSANSDANNQLTPEELQASIIRGPIEIDDATWTLSLRR